jgi:hypothetical protein
MIKASLRPKVKNYKYGNVKIACPELAEGCKYADA